MKRRGWLFALTAVAGMSLLAGCSKGGNDVASTGSPVSVTSTSLITTASSGFTTITSAPSPVVAAPACKLTTPATAVPNTPFDIHLNAPMPMAVADVTWHYGSTERKFTMKTDGSGAATHTLTLPDNSAGSVVTLAASFVVTHATCTTSFAVGAVPATPAPGVAAKPTKTTATTAAPATPACQLAVSGTPTAGGTATIVMTSTVPNTDANGNWQYGTVSRSFSMRTDGSGGATHVLNVPKDASGYTVVVQAAFPGTSAACVTSFPVA